jgi:putative endonuclease
MYYVYAIRSETRNYLYVGLTSDLDRRFNEHQAGHNRTTKPYCPFCLIHVETFSTRREARVREVYLKSGSGKEFLKSIP